MKILKYMLGMCCFMAVVYACTEDENSTDFLNDIAAPSNVSVLAVVTPDNTGLVTLTPSGEGATKFDIAYGDGSEDATDLIPGSSTQHIYEEGSYDILITATGINGAVTAVTQTINVAFIAPQDLLVTIENDAAISRQVNVVATADFAINYEVSFGDADNTSLMANIGEAVSFTYDAAGTYIITVTAFSAAIETTTYTEQFLVTEILQPLVAAPTPPNRNDDDVISMFSNSYALDVDVSSWRSDWSTSTLSDIQINDNDTKFYADADFVGVEFYGDAAVDATEMEFFHVDFWSLNATTFRIKLVDLGGTATEAEIVFEDIPQNEWVSLEIPMSDFLDAGMTSISSIQQLIFSGLPTGTFDFFIDNVYFYRTPTTYMPLLSDDFEGNGNIDSWTADALSIDINAPNVVNESINTSLTVLEYIDDGSGQYANVRFESDAVFDLASNSNFALKIYVPSSSVTGSQPNQISLKLQNNNLGGNAFSTQTEIIKPIVLDQWQMVTFDFATDPFINFDGGSPDPVNRSDLNRVVIQVNSENNFDAVTAYIDDFSYGPQIPAELPPFAMDDFEGNGNITNWTGDQATATTDVSNPQITGINYSSNILLYEDTGGQYANVQFSVTPKFDLMDKSKFTLKIYVPSSSVTGSEPNQISLKLQNTDLGGNAFSTQTEIIKPIVLDQWQQITFDFAVDTFINFDGGSPNPVDRSDLDKVVIQLNSENNFESVTGYIDDFKYH
ncbi:MAG: hypothetical protein WA775_04255 [Psychroserpens sp.]|uniref:hypothetical protein n=1 Tax=Psychroserpens sp. TaxID=2020870 RepID=UPI003CC2E763